MIEDALPLMANSTVRERILRINSDRSNFERDYQAWSDLVRSRQLQWRGYNLSGIENSSATRAYCLKRSI